MKLESRQVILWYSFALGISAGAALFAYLGTLEAVVGVVAVTIVSLYILFKVSKTEEENSSYLSLSEKVSIVGLFLFLPIIFTLGLLEALLLLAFFVQISLHFQTHDYRRFYMGIGISFAVLAAGAAEAKTGTYLLFILVYAITVSLALGYAYIEQRGKGQEKHWNGLDRFGASFWLVGTAIIIYLIIPRFPAGNLGATVSSDAFYHSNQWAEQAKKEEQKREEAPERLGGLLKETSQRSSEKNATQQPSQTDSDKKHGEQEQQMQNETTKHVKDLLKEIAQGNQEKYATQRPSQSGNNKEREVQVEQKLKVVNERVTEENADGNIEIDVSQQVGHTDSIKHSETQKKQKPSQTELDKWRQELGTESSEKALENQEELEYRYSGFEQSFDVRNPDAWGDRFTDNIIARMRSDKPLYLRIRVFDRFDGIRWHSSAHKLEKRTVKRDGVVLYSDEPQTNSSVESYEVFIERTIGNYIPAAAVPSHLRFPGTAIGIDAFGQLRSPKVMEAGTSYSVQSIRTVQNGRSFAEKKFVAVTDYYQLPQDFDSRIKKMALQVTAGSKTELQAAITLEQHLRSQYQLDHQPTLSSQELPPLSKFLFNGKRGHSEYFASALAMMLRTIDIPTRLVTGFSATNQNPLTGYYDIYALDGHAWVEAYVDELGWVELEPTAFYNGSVGQPNTLSAQQINDYVENQNLQQMALGERDTLTIAGLAITLWQSITDLVAQIGASINILLNHAWPWLSGLAVAAVIGQMLWLRIRPTWQAYRIRSRLISESITKPALALDIYLQAIDGLLKNAGLIRPSGITVERYLSGLNHELLPFDQTHLATVFNQVHYQQSNENVDTECYRKLFDALYQLGYRRLKDILVSISPSMNAFE